MQSAGNTIYKQPQGRIIGFDFMRSIAIILTLCRHAALDTSNVLKQIGWVGVHMFFVLSSFLITNILLTEYHRTGKINFFRFFIRRALKIYPLYYLFIVVSVYKNREIFIASWHYKKQLIGQLFHVQNYTDILWYHTWSLAAEEHFYIGVSIILSVYLFFSKSGNFKQLSLLFIAIIIAVPLLRYHESLLYYNDWFIQTHYIIDSFAIGALLALSKFVFPNIFSLLVEKKHWLLLPIGILLIPLFLLAPGNLWMNCLGLTLNFAASALLIIYFLSIENISRQNNFIATRIIRPLAWIGIASYSIYLLHVPVKSIVDSIQMPASLRIPVYFIACILAGKITWYLVEKPLAAYKSKFFALEK